MIQELLGEAAAGVLIGGERPKLSINNGVLLGGSSPSPSLSPSHSSSTVAPSPTGPSSAAENLRCPRCDSTNTKFCYYNNYNLTQPRHFCKTCRRYWTKGGALRNVPIGGGCRKNKNTTMNSAFMKSSAGKFKAPAREIGKSGFLSGVEHQLSSSSANPLLWASPQNSHLLSLLRANHNQNSNSNLNSNSNSAAVSIKPEEIVMSSGGARGQVSSASYLTGEGQNSGVQDFYQKVRSFTNFYPDAPPVVVGNVVSSSSSSLILDSAPVAAAESGYWNPILSTWSDMPTTNGAYP